VQKEARSFAKWFLWSGRQGRSSAIDAFKLCTENIRANLRKSMRCNIENSNVPGAASEELTPAAWSAGN
jgi:hypothetical protein